jgi:hypothetical protein
MILAAPVLVAAQGKSSTQHGTAPNGRPFTALQAQIDTFSDLGAAVLLLEARMATAEASLEDLAAHDALLDEWVAQLDQRWRDAEARLDAQDDSLQLLIEADRALQELIAAVELQTADQFGEVNDQLDGLQAELDAKQAAILSACPSGSAIRQISSTGGITCEAVSTTGGGSVGTLVTTHLSADSFTVVPPGDVGTSTIVCPSGYMSTGGGFHKSVAGEIFLDQPVTNGWRAAVMNTSTTDASVRAFVRCAVVVP